MKYLLLSLFIPTIAFTGGWSREAKINDLYFHVKDHALVFEIKWKEKEEIDKFRFVYGKWKNQSKWKYQLLPWLWGKLEKQYPRADFEYCINKLLDYHESGISFQLGEMGSAKYTIEADHKIVPFFKEYDSTLGKVCFMQANPT